MKQKTLVLIVLLTFCAGSFISLPGQQTLTFDQGARIKANSVDMKIDTYASVPCVVDWNEDGKKDLLVGCFFNGNVHLLLNSGSNSAPVFTTSSMLRAEGAVISVPYG